MSVLIFVGREPRFIGASCPHSLGSVVAATEAAADRNVMVHGPARAREIANRLIHRVRHVDALQFTRPVQPREHQRVAAIGLLVLALRLRRARGRHHDAADPELLQPSVHHVAGRPRFVDHVQAHALAPSLRNSFSSVPSSLAIVP